MLAGRASSDWALRPAAHEQHRLGAELTVFLVTVGVYRVSADVLVTVGAYRFVLTVFLVTVGVYRVAADVLVTVGADRFVYRIFSLLAQCVDRIYVVVMAL